MSSTIQIYRQGLDVYELLVRSITDYAIYMLDVDGYVKTWNAGAEKAKGYAESEIIGQHFGCFYRHQDRLEHIPARNLQIARNTGRFEGYGWRVRKDGSLFYAHVVLDALKNDAGEIFGFAKITRDCTEEHHRESQSRESERAFRYLVQSVTDYAIYMLDVNGVVSNWNAGAQAAKGYTPQEIIGRHFSCFYTPEDQASGAPERALSTALLEGRYETEGWRVRKDGRRFWAHVVIDPIYDDNGDLFGFAKVTRDRTEARRLQQQSFDHARRFRLLVEGVTDYAIYMLDPDGVVSNWNAGAQRAKGYEAAEIVGRHFSVFYTDADRAIGLPLRGLREARDKGRFEAQGWRVRKDGTHFWAHVVIQPIYDEDQHLFGYAKITRDCTGQRAAALALETTTRNLDLALDNMLQGLCLFDRHTRLVLSNQQFSRLFDLAEAPTPGLSLQALLRRIGRQALTVRGRGGELASRLRDAFSAGHAWRDAPVIVSGGRHIAFVTRQLSHGGWVSTFEDITQSRAAELQVRHLAHHDQLTGLPNRLAFLDTLQRMLTDTRRNQPFALLYLDLDRFKSVNDTLGHHAGDELLKAVAERLSANLRGTDQLARLGGDEFTILQGGGCGIRDAVALAARCIEQLTRPFTLGDTEVSIGVSIGIAQLPSGVEGPGPALQRADVALYAAKRDGRNCYKVYEEGMHDPLRESNELELDLRHALASNGLELHYQTIIDAGTGHPVACEALLRWHHPRRGPISPVDFIPLAEARGLMPELGRWVLMQACQDAAAWPAHVRVCVNVSPAQITHRHFLQTVQHALDSSRLLASRLELEITETTLLDSSDNARAVLNTIRSLGVGVAMDDFGIGYSSLGLLQDFPFSRIKIDRSFVHNMATNRKSAAIVSAIAGMCNKLDIPVTAEGVETEAQRLALLAEGCRELQGFMFARPVPVARLRWHALLCDDVPVASADRDGEPAA